MIRVFFPAAALMLAAAPLLSAQVRQGGPYQIQAESLNSGGTAVSGGTVYSQTATLSSLAGTASSPKYTLLSGFTAQLAAGGSTGTGEGQVAFAAWQTAIFGGTTDPPAAPAADPDGDGVTNLLEFMFNLDPLASGTPVLAAGAGNSGLPLIREETLGGARFITVEYIRRKNSGVQTVQETADLQTWGAAAFAALGNPVTVSPVYERVKLLVTPAISAGLPRFVRLNITVQ
ncbi:MAG: hypothetical protein JWM59_1740 [Verrucomicrobiales bacterium]|nr:hypothetical protein [Verrucomicrobiales bacterium]